MSEQYVTMYELSLELGTTRTEDGTWNYAPLKAGIDNIAEAMNYVINKYQFMANEGWGSTHVTGAHPEYTLTGKRILGDAAQDHIFSLKHVFGDGRESMLRLSFKDGSSGETVEKEILQPVTIADIQEWNGATTDDSAINIVLSCNGKPELNVVQASEQAEPASQQSDDPDAGQEQGN